MILDEGCRFEPAGFEPRPTRSAETTRPEYRGPWSANKMPQEIHPNPLIQSVLSTDLDSPPTVRHNRHSNEIRKHAGT